jgi:hypothetical protein
MAIGWTLRLPSPLGARQPGFFGKFGKQGEGQAKKAGQEGGGPGQLTHRQEKALNSPEGAKRLWGEVLFLIHYIVYAEIMPCNTKAGIT